MDKKDSSDFPQARFFACKKNWLLGAVILNPVSSSSSLPLSLLLSLPLLSLLLSLPLSSLTLLFLLLSSLDYKLYYEGLFHKAESLRN